MFELADAKQEYSELLNCSTKDWPAEQPLHCGPPSPENAPATIEWEALFFVVVAENWFLCSEKGCSWSYFVKMELTEFWAESCD